MEHVQHLHKDLFVDIPKLTRIFLDSLKVGWFWVSESTIRQGSRDGGIGEW